MGSGTVMLEKGLFLLGQPFSVQVIDLGQQVKQLSLVPRASATFAIIISGASELPSLPPTLTHSVGRWL